VCSIEELNRAKSQAARSARLRVIRFSDPISWGTGDPKRVRERESGSTLIFAQWAHNFRYCFARRRCTSASPLQPEWERKRHSLRGREWNSLSTLASVRVLVCVLGQSQWAFGVNFCPLWVSVFSYIPSSMCTLCNSHYVCVWKDFLVCEKDMETRFPFSRPAFSILHSRILSFRSPFFSILFRFLFATSSWPLQKGYYCNYLLIWP